jgi:predicted nucleotidyltransferase
MSILKELIEDLNKDKEIMKSFNKKDSLPIELFDKIGNSFKLKSDIREKLLEITNSFLDFIKIDFFIFDVHLTGSLANYNWSKYSDVDIHIIYDINEFMSNDEESKIYEEIIDEFFQSKKKYWNLTRNIKIKGYDVELYVQDINQKFLSTGVYSVLNDEWVIEPEKLKTPFNIDEKKILQKSNEFAKQIDSLINSSDKDVIKQIDNIKTKLKKFRQSGLEQGGEYSYENLTFKLLRRNGYIEKLMDLRSKVLDKELSIRQ